MGKTLGRIFGLIGLGVLSYFALSLMGSLAQLASFADRALPGSGAFIFWGLLLLFSALLATPVVLYWRLPPALVPPDGASAVEQAGFLRDFRSRLRKNPRLAGLALDSDDDVPAALARLSGEADRTIKETASAVFVSTAVMQNGRLDGLIVLATQLRMVWRIVSVYHYRPGPRQMFYLYSNVCANVLIADSLQDVDFAELATPIVASIFPSLKGAMPGLQGISALLVNSMANGAANAFLTLRVGLLAKAYSEATCTPSPVAVRHSTTATALVLVGKIVKEQGGRVARQAWSAVRGAVESAADGTLQVVRDAVSKATDTTLESARTVGGKIKGVWR